MKYVLMFTSRPDLDATIDKETMEADYKKIYEWFGTNADKIADGGAELLGVETATTRQVRRRTARWSSTARSTRPRRSSAGSASSTCRTWTRRSRSPRPGRASSFPGSAVEIRPMVEDYSQSWSSEPGR